MPTNELTKTPELAAVCRAKFAKALAEGDYFHAIHRAARAGASLAQIAREAGITRQRVHQILKEGEK